MAVTLRQGNINRAASTDFGSVDFKDDQTICDFVNARWQSRSQYRDALERQWYINMAHFLGHQYLQWNPVTKALYLPRQPRHRVRATVNRLMPLVRRIVSSTLKQKPTWTVSPATNELEDRITSQVSTDYLRYMWKQIGMNEKLVEALKWRSVTGNCFMRVMWDAFKGERIEATPGDLYGKTQGAAAKKKADKEGRKLLKEMGLVSPEDAEKMKDLNLYLGDVEVEVCTPFEIDPDPDATRWSDVTHLIHTKTRSVSYVKERYNLKEEDIEVTDGEALGSFYEKQIAAMTGSSGFGASASTSGAIHKNSSGVLVHQLWCRPHGEYNTGYWAVVIGNKCVRKSINQPGFPTFPYAHLEEVPVPGRLWGTCALEQCLPIQAAYNRARSQIIEHLNAISRPAWLIPKGSGIGQGSFTGEPGEKIFYTYPLKPELSKPGDLPNVTYHNVNHVIRDFEDVSNQHEATRGIAPGRVESGIGVAQLQEQDDSILAPASMLTADAVSDIGSWILQIASKKIIEERIIKIVGEDSLLDVRYFKGEDLTGRNADKPGVNYHDVTVEMGSSLPLSKAARQELGVQLAQFGILNPQIKEQREKLLEILEIGGGPSDVSSGQLDKANARRENAELMAGNPEAQIWPFDDDELHLTVHREFQKTPEYWKALQETGGLQSPIHQAFEMHIQSHAQRLAVSMMPPGMESPGAEQGEAPMPPGGGPPPLPMEGEAPPGDLPMDAGAIPDELIDMILGEGDSPEMEE